MVTIKLAAGWNGNPKSLTSNPPDGGSWYATRDDSRERCTRYGNTECTEYVSGHTTSIDL